MDGNGKTHDVTIQISQTRNVEFHLWEHRTIEEKGIQSYSGYQEPLGDEECNRFFFSKSP